MSCLKGNCVIGKGEMTLPLLHSPCVMYGMFKCTKEKKGAACIKSHTLETPHWASMIHNPWQMHNGEERVKPNQAEGDSEGKQMWAETFQKAGK